ncbi:MAG: molybdopterin biosynthesis protein [Pirellulales bacterium]
MSEHKQHQFLDVIDRDEAERRFHAALTLAPLAAEKISLTAVLGRVLACDVVAAVDVPSFDRSNFDGFAVRAEETFGAEEERPICLRLLAEVISTGVVPQSVVADGTAAVIATGGMVPRGANAVVMIEHTDTEGEQLIVRRAATPGFGIAFAGTDIGAGQTVLYAGQEVTSRESGVLAAVGHHQVEVFRRPLVAIISTGDEIIEPTAEMRPGMVFDSNAQILADAVRELGGEPLICGIVRDDMEQLGDIVRNAIRTADVVLLSGGTSKGAGDLSYRVIDELANPGIVAHGVALKPGKPICLAVENGKPVVILPGFPTSAIFTFHEFVAPVIRRLGGRVAESRSSISARIAVKVNSEIGRTEYLLVGLVQDEASAGLVAYPMGKGSGSVTAFSHADGFVTIGRHDEIVEPDSTVRVQLLGRDLKVADLIVVGSHCVGLDYLLGLLQQQGIATKFLAVGSTAGLAAAKRCECDIAGVHLLDEPSGEYNRPFLTPELELIRGYGRRQGVVFRPGDERFEQDGAAGAIAAVKDDRGCVMVNRNQGSGTRILIDGVLGDSRPPGYAVQSRSHNAVAAAIAQSRADWGVAIESVARRSNLGFLPLQDEHFDFVVPRARLERRAVRLFLKLLGDEEVRSQLRAFGFRE